MTSAAPAAIGPPVLLRQLEPTDRPLVYSNWLRSYRDSPTARLLTDTVYYAEERPVVRALVELCPPIVACVPSIPDQVYGWICGERIEADSAGALVVHFLYVSGAWRGWGIARQLLGALGYQPGETIVATHVTRIYSSGRLKAYRVVNNPNLALRRAWRLQ